MVRLSEQQTDDIVQSCLNSYKNLPKTGKPVEKEWTVLSCVVQYNNKNANHEVVSLGTGSKCIGANKMSPSGDVLNDSHAEIIARRSFLLYLYDLMAQDSTLFTIDNGKYKLNDHIEFIFYSSQLPCGDSSIIPKSDDTEHFGDVLHAKRPAECDICETETKKIRPAIDIHRTGAKCLPNSNQDLKEVGISYHVLGQVRTKPGRGDRTLSVSCSDKIARWVQMGIQGSLLDMLLSEPIHIKHFIFGAGVPYSKDTLNRALLNRDNSSVLPILIPEFYQSSIMFPFIRTGNNMRPAPGSIIWAKTWNSTLEVAVQGKKLGITKKKPISPEHSLCISKFKIFQKFQDILAKNKEIKIEALCDESVESLPYNEVKKRSKRYKEEWTKVKECFFKTWTRKPDIWNFCKKIS